MEILLISKTQGLGIFEGKSLDELIVGQARVSTSRELNDLFDEPHKLLRHCILNQHWSIFELANLGFRVETSRAIGREILRHGKMVGLTEFSQRYSDSIEFEDIELRKQATSNRQSSTDKVRDIIFDLEFAEGDIYKRWIKEGIAKETARMILPECTRTTMYLNFRIRELITFLNARLHNTAQKEIQDLAKEIRDIFIQECPIISNSLFNFEHADKFHILEQVVLEKYKLRDQVINENR
jgi:thymidylate synthase (FAD)